MSDIDSILVVKLPAESAEIIRPGDSSENLEDRNTENAVLKLVEIPEDSRKEKQKSELSEKETEISVDLEIKKEGSILENQEERKLDAICELSDTSNDEKVRKPFKKEIPNKEIPKGENLTEAVERKGTESGDVKISMAEREGPKPIGAVVITTAPTPTGPPKAKPKLMRRKSLNPRVMTPPGLEVLDSLQLLAIRQQMDMDIQGGCGAPNSYKIWNENDEQVFFASEESGCLCRWVCGPARQFSLDVFSATDDRVLNFHRMSCRCDCCCCLDSFMCLQKLYVVDCLGRTLGAVKQKFSVFNAKFDIVDHDNNVLFKILGPCCPCRCSTEIYFQILNKTGERQIGRIQKKWGGDRTDNINVDHEYFDVTFPANLDSVDKGLILGAAFLVNCMYLEMS